MAKDPAFLFYPGDWLGGTLGMSFEEKGAYMEVLMLQFNRGHMTEHMIRHVIGHNWDTLKVKFKQDDKGLWFNERLDVEKEKRKNFVNSRKNNISGENQHTKKEKNTSHKSTHIKGHMTSHMENENEIVNEFYIIVSDEKIFDAMPIISFYEAQLNGMEKENNNRAWRPLVENWFKQHIGESFKDNMHVKNSFKRYYLALETTSLNGNTKPKKPSFNLKDI